MASPEASLVISLAFAHMWYGVSHDHFTEGAYRVALLLLQDHIYDVVELLRESSYYVNEKNA